MVPGNGLGYGLLRYLNAQTASSLSGFAPPQLGFNYLGRFPVSADADWTIAREAEWLRGDPTTRLAHRVDINAMTLDSDDGATFTATWSWASALMKEDLVRDIANRWFHVLETLVRHADQLGGHSPGDFPLVALSQAEIERIESRYPQVADILPLSPLQEGLFFHALYDAEAQDVYTVQLDLGLEGALEATS